MSQSSDTTEFLNVDLELIATIDVTPLIEHFGPSTFVLRNSVDHDTRTVWLELSPEPPDADDAIRRFAALVESLPGEIRKYWDACDDRCLNIGIQSGFAPHAKAFPISMESIRKLSSIAARIEITVYRAGLDETENRKQRT